MRKFIYVLSTCFLALSATLFVACHNFLQILDPKAVNLNGEVTVTYSVKNDKERTTFPTIDWTDYMFMLCCKSAETKAGIEDAEEKDLFDSKKTYGAIGKSINVPKGWYKFILKAYTKDTDELVMQGTTTDVLDLTTEGKDMSLFMRPVVSASFKGSAEIIVKLPLTVTKMQYGWISDKTFQETLATDISASEESTSASGWTSNADYRIKTFSAQNLPAGLSNYFYIKFFEGTEHVGTRIESLWIANNLTSKSTIVVSDNVIRTFPVTINLKKDGQPWLYNGKTLILVDSDGNEYVLRDDFNKGEFKLPEVEGGEYNIYIRSNDDESGSKIDTGLNFSPKSGNITNDAQEILDSVNFVDTEIKSKGVTLTPVTPMPSALPSETQGNILVVDGSTVPIEFTVELQPGYEADPSGNGVVVNGKKVFNSDNSANIDEDTNPVADGMQQKYTEDQLGNITVTGTKLIQYTVSYVNHTATGEVNLYEVWKNGFPASFTYTVETTNIPALKSAADISREVPLEGGGSKTYTFNGWKNIETTGSNASKSLLAIPQGSWGNITLEALWKDGVVIPPDPPSPQEAAAGVEGTVLTSGYSLIVKWDNDTSHTKTLVYIDNGTIGKYEEGIDTKVTYIKDEVVQDDFTNFKLSAKNNDGSAPTNDYTFTIIGGRLACVEGPGLDFTHNSNVNISGKDTFIGSDTNNNGVLLNTFESQRVNVNAALTGNYSISLVAGTKYRAGASTNTIATIADSSYAQLAKFKCIYNETDPAVIAKYNEKHGTSYPTNTPVYLPQEITANKTGTEIQLANTDPIITDENGIIWNPEGRGDAYQNTEFSFGEGTLISVPCSVFSVSVTNGSFRLTQKEMSGTTTTRLAQYTSGSTVNYHENDSISTDTGSGSTVAPGTAYTYLHMLSGSNDITPEKATEFLKSIIFVKKGAGDSNKIKIQIKLETVPYAEILNFKNQTLPVLSGLSQTVKEFAYYDGSFYCYVSYRDKSPTYTEMENFDWISCYNYAKGMVFNGLNGYLMTISSEVENSYIVDKLEANYAWTGGSRVKGNDSNDFDFETFPKTKSEYTYNTSYKNNPPEPNTYSDFYWQCGPEAGQKFWNGTSSSGSAVTGMYTKFASGEPNRTQGTSPYVYESCIQYKDKSWNDMPVRGYANSSSSIKPRGYVVEFRPYKNEWSEYKATKQSISLDCAY